MVGKTSMVESDPRHHTAKIKGMLEDLIAHLRDDVEKVDEPRAQALFETSAEVLNGLKTAYDHYDEGSGNGLSKAIRACCRQFATNRPCAIEQSLELIPTINFQGKRTNDIRGDIHQFSARWGNSHQIHL